MGRGLVILVVVLGVAFWLSSIMARRKRERELSVEWEAQGGHGIRSDYVADGLARYDRSLRRWMLLAIMVVPLALVACIVYVVNFM